MIFTVDYKAGKITLDKERQFFQAENLINKISIYVTNTGTDNYFVSMEFILPNGRKSSMLVRDTFAAGEAQSIVIGGKTYLIHNFTLNSTIMNCAGMLSFTAYINFVDSSGNVKSRGVLVNGVNQVVKTTGYTDSTIIELGSGADAGQVVADFKASMTSMTGSLANKMATDGSNCADEVTLKDVTLDKINIHSVSDDDYKQNTYIETMYDNENNDKRVKVSFTNQDGDGEETLEGDYILASVEDVSACLSEANTYTDTEYNKKVDKFTTTSSNDRMFVQKANGTIIAMPLFSDANVGNQSIPLRDSEGRMKTESPTDNKDVANKSYVDTQDTATYNTATAWSKEYTDAKVLEHVKSASVSKNTTTGTYTMHFKDASGTDLFTCDWDTPDEYIIDTDRTPLVQTTYNDDGSVASQTTTIYLFGGQSFTIDTSSMVLLSGSTDSDLVKIIVENGTIRAVVSATITNVFNNEATRIANENLRKSAENERISAENARVAYYNAFKNAMDNNYQLGGYKLTDNRDGTYTLEIKSL